jgi:DNA polymerase-3 subunit beta
MKIVVSKTVIEKAVSNICRVINSKNALPILGDILCSVNEQDKTMTLTGSDSEIYLQYTILLKEAEGGGEFCVDDGFLKKALAELNEQPVEIIADTENGLAAKFRLKHESGETEIPLENADEYPRSQDIADDYILWNLDGGMVKRTLKRSLFATANDDLRPVMNGICFNYDGDHLDIVASNGHVLIRNTENVDITTNQPGSFIMLKKVSKLLPELLDADSEIDVLFNEKQCRIEQESMTIQFRLIEGKYPNYNSVIPDNTPYSFDADRESMLKAARNVVSFTNSSNRLVVMGIGSQKLTLYGEDYDFSFKSTDSIGIENHHGNDMRIGVNGESLINELSRLAEQTVTVNYTDKSRAFTINPTDPICKDEEITMLLIPLLFNE